MPEALPCPAAPAQSLGAYVERFRSGMVYVPPEDWPYRLYPFLTDLVARYGTPADLLGRSDDWWAGFHAGCEASHAARCDDVETERDNLRDQLARTRVSGEQRITDLKAEFGRQYKGLERQLEQARSAAPPVVPEARGGEAR